MINSRRLGGALAGAFLGLGLFACGDILEVQDPSRYTSSDLDEALQAVVDGVEGDLHNNFSGMFFGLALGSDEMQHSGTWSGWDDIDHGRWLYDVGGISNGGLMQTRWFARDSQERLKRVLGEAAAMQTVGMAQVMAVEGWSDLINAENFCEAVAEASGPAVTHQALMAQAKAELTEAMAVAQGAGSDHYYLWALAGRARANLWLGKDTEALADARAVLAADPDFVYYAQYSVNSGAFGWVTLATVGENSAGSLREKWWPYVDDDAHLMRDVYTGELDPRLPIYHDGTKAVDGLTEFYSQWKYQDRNADVKLSHSGEMKLIEAEVLWRQNNLAGALAALNFLRTRAGLTPHAATSDADQVFEYFMHEMFAELFMEGRRFGYLNRLGQVEEIFGAMNDPERPLPRPTMFAISSGEAQYNANLTDNAADRCLPMSGSSF